MTEPNNHMGGMIFGFTLLVLSSLIPESSATGSDDEAPYLDLDCGFVRAEVVEKNGYQHLIPGRRQPLDPKCFLRGAPLEKSDPKPIDVIAAPAALKEALKQMDPPKSNCPPESKCPKGHYKINGKCSDSKALDVIVKRMKPAEPEPISKEARELGEKLRQEFDKEQNCPRNLLDIAALRKLVKLGTSHQDKHQDKVNVQPLIVEQGTGAEYAKLCGLSESRWFPSLNFFCTSGGECYQQGDVGLPSDCFSYRRLADRPATWSGVKRCDHPWSIPGYEAGEFMHLVPLGEGVFLNAILHDAQSEPFAIGVVFAPTSAIKGGDRFADTFQAALKAARSRDRKTVVEWRRWFTSSQKQLSKAERKRLEQMIGAAEEATQ